MAEDQEDKDSRTEEPTAKRVADAMEKGNVPIARDLTLLGSLIGILAAFSLLGAWMGARLSAALRDLFAAVGDLRLEDREAATILTVSLAADIGLMLLPVLAIVAAGSIVASIIQSPPALVSQRIMPQLSRISPMSGWQRLYGRAGLLEFLKAVVKLVVAAIVVWLVMRSLFSGLSALTTSEPQSLLEFLSGAAGSILVPLVLLAAALASADILLARLNWRRGLRMTRRELQEEMKEAEGDPYIKARIRSIARQRASGRMLEKLPTASLVIANPTHYAVALRYAPSEKGAPVVVAKGLDHLALKIREIAEGHDIPVVEDKPLARALYDVVEVDVEIPAEFYRAVAEILHFLNSRNRLPRHSAIK